MRRCIALFTALTLSSPVLADEVTWHELRSPSAEASSYLQTNWNRFTENYHPTYVLDEDPKTAWVEGVDGLGEGQVLTVPLSAVRSARQVRVRIRNGYQKSAGLLSANAAPNTVRLRMVDGSGTVTGQVETSLEKAMGWQTVVIPLEGRGFDHLELEIVTVHDGTRYRDTCISDILVDVDSDQEWSAQGERGRLFLAQQWIAERVEAARFFASQPVDYPFVTSGYQSERGEVDGALTDQMFTDQRVILARIKALEPWYNASHTRRIEAVDGVGHLTHVLQEFSPANIAWFETDRRDGVHLQDVINEGEEESWVVSETWRTNSKIEWADDTHSRPRRLFLHVKDASYGRGTFTREVDYVLTYNASGRVTSLYTSSASMDEMGLPQTNETFFRFRHNGEGAVDSWTRTEHSVVPDWDTFVEQPDGSVHAQGKVYRNLFETTAVGG